MRVHYRYRHFAFSSWQKRSQPKVIFLFNCEESAQRRQNIARSGGWAGGKRTRVESRHSRSPRQLHVGSRSPHNTKHILAFKLPHRVGYNNPLLNVEGSPSHNNYGHCTPENATPSSNYLRIIIRAQRAVTVLRQCRHKNSALHPTRKKVQWSVN